jgi:hypothetical protein
VKGLNPNDKIEDLYIESPPPILDALSNVSSRPNSPIGVHGESSQLRQVCCLLPKLAAPEHRPGLTTGHTHYPGCSSSLSSVRMRQMRTAAALLLLAGTGLAAADLEPYACTGQRAMVGGVTYKTKIKLVSAISRAPPQVPSPCSRGTHLSDLLALNAEATWLLLGCHTGSGRHP